MTHPNYPVTILQNAIRHIAEQVTAKPVRRKNEDFNRYWEREQRWMAPIDAIARIGEARGEIFATAGDPLYWTKINLDEFFSDNPSGWEPDWTRRVTDK